MYFFMSTIYYLTYYISGAYLIACGPRGALIFMSWLGINVLPKEEVKISDDVDSSRPVGSILVDDNTQVSYFLSFNFFFT